VLQSYVLVPVLIRRVPVNDEEIEKYIDLVNQIKDGKVKNGENEENKDEENKDEENEDGENEDGDGDEENEDGDGDEDEEDGDEEDGEQENEEGDEQDDNENPNKDVFSMDDVGEYGRMKKIRQNRTPDFKWFYIVSGTDGPSMEILAFWEAKLKSDALDQMSIQASFILKKWDRQFIWGLEVKIKENQIYLCSHKFTRKNTKKLPAYALSKENEEREEYTEQSGRRRSGKKRGEWFPMFDVSGNEILDYSKPFMDAIDNIMKDNHLEAVDWHSRPKTAWSEMEVTKTGENVTKRQKVKK